MVIQNTPLSNQIFLTDNLIKTLVCPDGLRQIIYWDNPIDIDGKARHGAQAGLGLKITDKAHKTFVHDFKFNGKRKRIVIGSFQTTNIASARLAVQEREIEISKGFDPSQSFIDYRKAHTLTVRQIIDEYFAGRMCRLSIANQRSFRGTVAPWLEVKGQRRRRGGPAKSKVVPFGQLYGDMPAEHVRPKLIAEYINGIPRDSQANNTLRHIKALFNWCLKMQIIDMRNPCDPIDMRRTVRRRRDYTLAQIRQVAQTVFNPPLRDSIEYQDLTGVDKRRSALAQGAITQANDQLVELCNFMGILMLTMVRPSDLKTAEFSHFDLDQLIWHKHDTKGLKLSKSHYQYAYRSIPIHPKVSDLIIEQRNRWPEAKFVFPSHEDMIKPRNNFNRAMQRFKALPTIPDYFQLYDLKRMAISLMITGQGVSRDAVSHYSDHHGNLETTLIYDLGLVDPLRPVAQRLGELLEVDA